MQKVQSLRSLSVGVLVALLLGVPVAAPRLVHAQGKVPQGLWLCDAVAGDKTKDAVNVRFGPGTRYDVAYVLKKGERVTIVAMDITKEWYAVYLSPDDTRLLWIYRSLLKVDMRSCD